MSGTKKTINANQRVCSIPECDISKLVPMVAKRKTSQFVTSPRVNEKPLLIKGLRTVFQIEGRAANLGNLHVNSECGDESPHSPIYRIKQNTHAHFVNYIIIDENSEAMRKINEGDIETMRILLESQRGSAEVNLKKLISNHVASANAAAANTTTTIATNTRATTTTVALPSTTTNCVSKAPTPSVTSTPSGIRLTSAFSNLQPHPNLKITSVASASGERARLSTHPPTIIPFIKPVTLSSIKKVATPLPVKRAPPQPQLTPSSQMNVETPLIKKLNDELRELQRKIEMLAERQRP